jgi:hypothetical protein
MTKAKIKAFHEAIGRFVLSWADLEVGLDLLVLTTRLMQETSHRETPPHELRQKIKFVRCKANELESLNAQRSTIIKILAEIDSLAETRHDFVHGAVIGSYVERSTISVTLARLLQPRKHQRRKPIKITTAEINEKSNLVRAISDRLLDVVEAINAHTK